MKRLLDVIKTTFKNRWMLAGLGILMAGAIMADTATPTVTGTMTPTITKTSTVTQTTTPTITPTFTPTYGAGAGYITPNSYGYGKAGLIEAVYDNKSWAIANGLLVFTVPSGFPTPSTSSGDASYTFVTATGAVLGSPSFSGQSISIPITSMAANAGNRVYVIYADHLTPIMTPVTAGTYQFLFQVNPSSQSATAVVTVNPTWMNYTQIGATATATPTITTTNAPTSTITPTPTTTAITPNAPIVITGATLINAYPCWIKSIDILNEAKNGELYVCNVSSTAYATAASVVMSISPTSGVSMPFPFGGKGLYFSNGVVAYTKVTYASAVNNTVTAHFGQ